MARKSAIRLKTTKTIDEVARDKSSVLQTATKGLTSINAVTVNPSSNWVKRASVTGKFIIDSQVERGPFLGIKRTK